MCRAAFTDHASLPLWQSASATIRELFRVMLQSAVAQLTSEKAVAEAYAGELKTALEEAYEYIEQLEEERSGLRGHY